jgi:hypothetical protein
MGDVDELPVAWSGHRTLGVTSLAEAFDITPTLVLDIHTVSPFGGHLSAKRYTRYTCVEGIVCLEHACLWPMLSLINKVDMLNINPDLYSSTDHGG